MKTAAQVGIYFDATTIKIRVDHARTAGIDSKNLVLNDFSIVFVV